MNAVRSLLVNLVFVTSLISSLSSASAADNSSNKLPKREKVTIQLKWFHQFQFAGYYAAKEKGFYAEEGLDVELRELDPTTNYINDVLIGKAQYGIADAGLVFSRLQGKPVVLLAQIFQQSPLVFITLKESGIQEAKDLADKRVMYYEKGLGDMPLVAMLEKTLGGINKVKVLPQTFDKQELINGNTDAVSAYLTNEPHWYQERNIAINIINPRDYGIEFYGDNLFTTEQELQENPQRVEKIRRATIKGWQYALDNRDEIIDLILEKYNSQQHSRDHLEFEARETGKLVLPHLLKIGSFDQVRYHKISSIYIKAGVLTETKLNPAFFYQNLTNKSHQADQLNLTREEKAWLAKNPVIALGNSINWPPFGYIQEGRFTGISADYINHIGKLLNVEFKPVMLDSWGETIMAAKNGKVDVLSSIVPTPQRESYLNFTRPYLSYPMVIATLNNVAFISNMHSLDNEQVAVTSGSTAHDLLKKYHPHYKIVPVKNTREGLLEVATGNVKAFIGVLPTIGSVVASEGMTNIKIAGVSPYHYEIAMAINKNKPQLASIMDKAIDSISEEQHNRFRQKWMGVNYKNGIDYTLASQFLGFIVLIFVFILLWIRHRQVTTLTTEIKMREEAEKN